MIRSGNVELAELLRDLSEAEGIDVEELVEWAHARASELLRGVERDEELGPLLAGRRSSAAPGTALPPIPSSPLHAGPPDDDTEDIEVLDDGDLELLDENDVTKALSWSVADPHPADSHDLGPVDQAERGGTEPADYDQTAATAASWSGPSRVRAPDGTPPAGVEAVTGSSQGLDPSRFGPPDLGADVPEWKAALATAQVGEAMAAHRVREDSAGAPPPSGSPPSPMRSEEDPISRHAVDLSDLDDQQ